MGALDAAEEASSIAVRTALAHLISSTSPIATRLTESSIKANESLFSAAAGRDLGTSLTCVGIIDATLFFAHLGDARLIHYTEGITKYLTEDHSKLAKHLKIPNPSIDEVKRAATSRMVTKSLGVKQFDQAYVMVPPSPGGITLRSGDYLVLCTDGVWTEMTTEDIELIVRTNSPYDAARILCELSISKDPTDDVSAVVVHVEDVLQAK